MTSKNKKNLGNKIGAAIPAAVPADSAQGASAAVVVDIRTGRQYAAKQSISPAAEGLRLVQAFFKISDPIKRAELIKMAEDYVRRAHR
jgi:hypothetical protein